MKELQKHAHTVSVGQLLPRSFYARDAETVARELLGATLVHEHEGAPVSARIVETEAYVGQHDLACHASRGRTKRTEVMFGPPGYAYVYLIYGMYDMLNVVTGAVGDAEAVLIRAAQGCPPLAPSLNGPGKLTRALGVSRRFHNGVDLCAHSDSTGSKLFLLAGVPPKRMVVTTRIGVEYAGLWKDAPLRFYDADSSEVSKK